MDPIVSEAVAPAADNELKKHPMARKPVKDLTLDERRKESEKHASRYKPVKNRQNTARLEEERRLETEQFLAAQALANSEELASKAAVRTVMMTRPDATNITFSGVASMPPS
jgi:hypothetical protein